MHLEIYTHLSAAFLKGVTLGFESTQESDLQIPSLGHTLPLLSGIGDINIDQHKAAMVCENVPACDSQSISFCL